LPTIATRVSTSGPLPIERRALDGRGDLAVLDEVGLARREHELAEVMSTWPPPKFTA
jgi:hypothetical protein